MMNTTVVRIGGKGIEIPNREIASLITQLTSIHHNLLVTGAIGATPRQGYLSHDECQEMLAELYSGNMLRVHSGNLWGAICRLARFDRLHFDTKCVICDGRMEEVSVVNGKTCRHSLGSVGYRMVLISQASIQANLMNFMEGDFHQIGNSIKSDYRFIANELSK